jgi:hypothetical protein
MSDLREDVAFEICARAFGFGERELSEIDRDGADWKTALETADAILALRDVHEFFAKPPNLDHSISTGTKKD